MQTYSSAASVPLLWTSVGPTGPLNMLSVRALKETKNKIEKKKIDNLKKVSGTGLIVKFLACQFQHYSTRLFFLSGCDKIFLARIGLDVVLCLQGVLQRSMTKVHWPPWISLFANLTGASYILLYICARHTTSTRDWPIPVSVSEILAYRHIFQCRQYRYRQSKKLRECSFQQYRYRQYWQRSISAYRRNGKKSGIGRSLTSTPGII